MLTCEKCGVSFKQPETVVEVTSLRVLCPTCAAERAAAKASKAAAAAAPRGEAVPAATRASAAGVRPSLPTQPRATVNDFPPPGTLQPSRKEEPGAARPALPRRPAGEVGSSPGPRHSTQAAAGRAPASPGPVKKPVARKHKKHVDLDTLASSQLKKRGSRESLLAFGSAVVVIAIAGVVLWKVLGRKKEEAAVERARLERIENFRASFMAFDLATEEGAQRLIAFADENKPIWNEQEFAAEVMTRTAKAKTFLEGLEERRTLTARLEEIEGIMARAAELPPGDLAEQRRRLEEVAAKADLVGTEFVARVNKDREDADRIYLERLVSSAETAAAAEPLDRAALTALQQAEDEVLKIYENSYRAWQKNMQDPVVKEKKDEHESRYKALIQLSDQAVEHFFTPEAIENTPWRDLLAPDQVSLWRGGSDVKGFERRIDNGVMHLVGPDPSEKSEVISSIGDKEIWRDFLLEMEFTILKGRTTLYFRLPPVWQENVESLELTTDEGAFEAGRSYTYAYKVLASTFAEEDLGEDSLGPTVKNISWTRVRKGAFGISIPKDTEIKFTRLRAKVLR